MLPPHAARLPRDLFEAHTTEVAAALLGKLLVRATPEGPRIGRIVETEAYHGTEDLACHAARGQTPRNAPMFGRAGTAYVYRIYGVWDCLNAVTGPEGFPSAVLIRAVAPVSDFGPRDGAGPGKLCRLLDIGRDLNRVDLVQGEELFFADDGVQFEPEAIATGPRIGVDYAGHAAAWPWRYWVSGAPSVSVKPRATRRTTPEPPPRPAG